MFESSPSSPERRKQIRFFRIGDILKEDGIKILSSVVDAKKLKKILELRLENSETREAFAKRFLDVIAAGLDERDGAKTIAGLVGIGAGVTSLMATEYERDRPLFFGSSVARDSSGKYIVPFGSGTGGQRILLRPRPREIENDGFERLLVFPSQGEGISGDSQRGFELLLGSRVRNIAEPQQDPYLVATITENNDVDLCPCGNGKKFKECHGA